MKTAKSVWEHLESQVNNFENITESNVPSVYYPANLNNRNIRISFTMRKKNYIEVTMCIKGIYYYKKSFSKCLFFEFNLKHHLTEMKQQVIQRFDTLLNNEIYKLLKE